MPPPWKQNTLIDISRISGIAAAPFYQGQSNRPVVISVHWIYPANNMVQIRDGGRYDR